MVELLTQIITALMVGFIVGIIFSAIKLPLPAPPAIAGIVGILGIYLGHKCWIWVATTYFK